MTEDTPQDEEGCLPTDVEDAAQNLEDTRGYPPEEEDTPQDEEDTPQDVEDTPPDEEDTPRDEDTPKMWRIPTRMKAKKRKMIRVPGQLNPI